MNKETTPKTETSVDRPSPKKSSTRLMVLLTFIAIFIFLSIYQSYRAYFAPSSDKDNLIEKSSEPVATESTNPEAPTSATTNTPTGSSQKPTSTQYSSNSPSSSAVTNQGSTSSVKEQTIAYFLDIAAGVSTGIEKWTKSLVYVGSAPGVLDDSFTSCLDGFIRDFNSASAGVKLQKNNELADIKIYVLAPEQIQTDGNQRYGYAYNRRDSQNGYESAEIFLSTDTPDNPLTRCYLIRHELMHTVGFRGHSDSSPEGIMAVASTSNTNINNSMVEVDRKAIQMLYNIGLPLKTATTDARTYVTAHYPN